MTRSESTHRPAWAGRISIAAIVTVSLALGIGLCVGAAFRSGSPAPPEIRPVTAQEPPQSLLPAERQVVDIFREASKSVVFIANNAYRSDWFSRRVYEVPQGTGSGFVWDKEGHIITNYHVVRRADNVKVTLQDQSVHKAKMVGYFDAKELAVLKIEAPPESLHPIRVGRSDELQVGMTALAIGNPFGLDHTLTVGVISALNREIQSLTGRAITEVIQTDAAINPGNSGGPLLNSSGQLIGVNTAILSPSGVNAGIGFAVPVDIVRRYVEQIIKYGGKVKGAGLGVALLEDDWSRRFRVQGVIIREVVRGGAAAKAGLRGLRISQEGEIEQLGDVIQALDEKPVRNINGLRDLLERYAVGDEVEVTYEREQKVRKAKVKLQQIDLQNEDE